MCWISLKALLTLTTAPGPLAPLHTRGRVERAVPAHQTRRQRPCPSPSPPGRHRPRCLARPTLTPPFSRQSLQRPRPAPPRSARLDTANTALPGAGTRRAEKATQSAAAAARSVLPVHTTLRRAAPRAKARAPTAAPLCAHGAAFLLSASSCARAAGRSAGQSGGKECGERGGCGAQCRTRPSPPSQRDTP